jgi:hypothetical protein
MERYDNGSLTLNDYFEKISQTIGKNSQQY